MTWLVRLIALPALCLLPGATLAGEVAHWESALVLEGEAAPGTGGGSYSAFHPPTATLHGDVAFAADVIGGTALSGVFRKSFAPPDHRALALQGQTAPVPGVQLYAGFPSAAPAFDFEYNVAFLADLTPPGPARGIFLADQTGVVGAQVLSGDPAPGGGSFAAFTSPLSYQSAFDATQQLAFSANVSGGSAASGIFLLPEPGAPGALLAGAALTARLGSRRRARAI